VAKDAGRGKATFVSLLGLEPARARARALALEACDALAPTDPMPTPCARPPASSPPAGSEAHDRRPSPPHAAPRPGPRPADLKRLSDAELKRLADELRAETISAVSVTGGHLGAGLGVVELTVALHAVFHTPRDRLIWDVGHQAYPTRS
jgi:hypothetical protein